jgi:uncharacterized UPF0160 family protein
MTIGDVTYKTRLSSAGLVYKHFGREVIAKICGWKEVEKKTELEMLYKKLYEDFVEAFDGNDNGVPRYPPDVKPNYHDSTHIAARVSYVHVPECVFS